MQLLVNVVAQCGDVYAVMVKLLEQLGGQSAPPGRVLGVADDEISFTLGYQRLEMIGEEGSAGLAHDVADAQDVHRHTD